MPYRKEKFENGNIVHIILRGINGNKIFKDINDYYRGIFSIYEFNDLNPVNIKRRREIRNSFKKKIRRGRASTDFIDKRNRVVDFLSFCFMPNHIHLLLKQIKDNGITKFMSKVGTGYGGYFNRKYKRKGHVFQERFNSVHIENENQLRVAFAYIHTNPLSLMYPKWKEIRIKNPDEAMNFLESYRWSSYLDCIGTKNFPSVTQRDFIVDLMNGPEGCKEFIKNWIIYKGEAEEYSNLFLE